MVSSVYDVLFARLSAFHPETMREAAWLLYAIERDRQAYEKNASRVLKAADRLSNTSGPYYDAYVWSGEDHTVERAIRSAEQATTISIEEAFLLSYCFVPEQEMTRQAMKNLLKIMRSMPPRSMRERLMQAATLRILGDNRKPEFFSRSNLEESIAAAWYVEHHTLDGVSCHSIWAELIPRYYANHEHLDIVSMALLFEACCRHLFTRRR